MNIKTALLATALLLLAGCSQSPEEKAREQDQKCQSFGARPGTPEYIQCRATIEANDIRRGRDSDNSAVAGFAIGMAAGTSARR